MNERFRGRKEFVLEALEPRVLLSGTDLVAPVAPPTNIHVLSDEAQPADSIQSASGAISYDPAAHVSNILGDTAAGQAQATEPSGAQTPASENPASSQSNSSNNSKMPALPDSLPTWRG